MEVERVWIVETREELCAHSVWSIDTVWKNFEDGNKYLMGLAQDPGFDNMGLRMRGWTLR